MKRKWMIGLAVILVLLAAGAGGAAWVWNGLQPAPGGKPVKFTIPAGSGSRGVADALEKNGVIRNKMVFMAYLKYKNEGSRFQAGEYEMAPGMPLDEIIAKLNRGETVKEETLRFTIPEGFTFRQIADKLAEQTTVDKSKFVALAEDPQASGIALPAPLPTDPNITHKLEGYLFPETYEMKKGSTELDILNRMAEEGKKKLESLPNLQDKLKERKMSLHQLLTVASLVEREAAVAEERPLIAGVIYNRLEKGMPLQIDATVQYALPEYKERLFESDLKVDSPYNTYRNKGLPPGPIANPGLSSINAALNPEKSKYFFYVTKKDGSRRHLFAETHDQHLKNIELSKKTEPAVKK